MSAIKNMVAIFLRDERGASFLEYTFLLTIILSGVILLTRAVGSWANGQWSALNSALQAIGGT